MRIIRKTQLTNRMMEAKVQVSEAGHRSRRKVTPLLHSLKLLATAMAMLAPDPMCSSMVHLPHTITAPHLVARAEHPLRDPPRTLMAKACKELMVATIASTLHTMEDRVRTPMVMDLLRIMDTVSMVTTSHQKEGSKLPQVQEASGIL